MPALPDVPQVLKLRLHWQIGLDVSAVTILHWQYSGAAPTSTALHTFCANLNGATSAQWPGMLDTDTKFLGCDIVDLTSPTSGVGGDSTSVIGTRSGDPLGASTAMLTTYSVSRRYRGGKPRSYYPFGTSSDLSTRNTWDTGVVSFYEGQLAVLYTAIDSAFTGAGITPVGQVNVSYYGPPNRTITGSTGRVRTISTVRATPLIDAVGNPLISDKVSSQRRRNLQR